MPTYEYACAGCKHEWELEQRITEEPVKKCPKCGKAKARRLVGSGNFILKGGGWYSDLYSSPAPKKKESTETGESSSSASETKSDSTSSSSETKPEAKPEKKPEKKDKKKASSKD